MLTDQDKEEIRKIIKEEIRWALYGPPLPPRKPRLNYNKPAYFPPVDFTSGLK